MVDPALFRSRTFSVSVTIGMIFNFCLYGSLFCLAILSYTQYIDFATESASVKSCLDF